MIAEQLAKVFSLADIGPVGVMRLGGIAGAIADRVIAALRSVGCKHKDEVVAYAKSIADKIVEYDLKSLPNAVVEPAVDAWFRKTAHRLIDEAAELACPVAPNALVQDQPISHD